MMPSLRSLFGGTVELLLRLRDELTQKEQVRAKWKGALPWPARQTLKLERKWAALVTMERWNMAHIDQQKALQRVKQLI